MKMLICLLLVFGIFACASLPAHRFMVTDENLEIIVMDEEDVLTLARKMLGRAARGLCVFSNPIRIYVPYSSESDARGNRLPDFAVLGHEIWHLRELGGNFDGSR